MSSDPLGVIVIGTGGIGSHHVRNWKGVAGARVVGVFDVMQPAAERVAREFDVPRVYSSLEAALGDSDAAIADVCTPNMAHRATVLAALATGKHVLCEKPLGATPEDIRAMIAARDAAGTLLMTAQHLRFDPATAAVRRLIAAGRVGDIYYTRAWWLRRRRAPSTPGFLSRQQAGFGVGVDLGVHVIDLVLHLLGQPQAISVAGYSATRLARLPEVANEWGTFAAQQFEVEEFAGGLVRFADGGILNLEVSWLLNMTPLEVRGIWLHGTAGGLSWPELKLNQVQDGIMLDAQVVSPLSGDGYRPELAAFVEAVRRGGPSPVPAEESLKVAEILAALYKSADCGQEVRLG